LYDIDINYHRRQPIPNVPNGKGTFLLGVEKDAKQRNLRRSFVKKENKKLINKLNEISTKDGRLNKGRLDPKILVHSRISLDDRKKKTPLRPMNNLTLKKQLWSNKNIRTHLDRAEVSGQNMVRVLGGNKKYFDRIY
jgi:hypothetical protein